MTSTIERPPPSRLDRLIDGRYRIQRYADLTAPYQLAIACYMAVNGEAWESLPGPPGKRPPQMVAAALRKALPSYIHLHGDWRFGVVRLPVADVLQAVMADPELAADWPNWKAYHRWYCLPSSGNTPQHPRRGRWPVVLSSDNSETLQDGWHRLHCYVRQKARHIPAVFFPQDHHLTPA